MANTMSTRVQFKNLNEETFGKLMEILPIDEKEKYYVDTNSHLKSLFGEEWDGEFGYEWMNDNVGSKWINIECPSREFDPELDLFIETAWSVPTGWLEKITEVLTNMDPKVALVGTYEDEGQEPMGAFVYGHNYDDMEDLDVEIDHDRWWDEDEYRDEIFGDLDNLKENLYEGYLDTMEDRKDEE